MVSVVLQWELAIYTSMVLQWKFMKYTFYGILHIKVSNILSMAQMN